LSLPTQILWPIEWKHVEVAIRKVPQYQENVSLEYIIVSPNSLRPLCLYVRTYRLIEVRAFLTRLVPLGIPLFDGVVTISSDGTKRLIPPPIVEQHGKHLVIIDGLHRVYESIQTKQDQIKVALVRGELEKLPADMLKWEEVSVTDQKLPRTKKFRNLDESRFRHINRFIDEEIFVP